MHSQCCWCCQNCQGWIQLNDLPGDMAFGSCCHSAGSLPSFSMRVLKSAYDHQIQKVTRVYKFLEQNWEILPKSYLSYTVSLNSWKGPLRNTELTEPEERSICRSPKSIGSLQGKSLLHWSAIYDLHSVHSHIQMHYTCCNTCCTTCCTTFCTSRQGTTLPKWEDMSVPSTTCIGPKRLFHFIVRVPNDTNDMKWHLNSKDLYPVLVEPWKTTKRKER